MIENGWAVIYKRYSYPEEYLIIEQKAKIQKKGLWHSKQYIDKARKTQFTSSVNCLRLQ